MVKRNVGIDEDAQDYQDSVSKEEINNMLRIISVQLKHLSGNDLDILKKYLKKIIDY